jgi:hypothetical protein
MKNLLTLSMIVLVLLAKAQSPETLQKIESAKIALISERLSLTPEQAQKFWPIYNEFFQKQREMRGEFEQMRRNFDPKTASEEENRKMLETGMKVKENQLTLEREYSERMLQVISTRQLMSLRKTEEEFRQMLMDRMRQRNMDQQRLEQNRNQNDNRMNKQRN